MYVSAPVSGKTIDAPQLCVELTYLLVVSLFLFLVLVLLAGPGPTSPLYLPPSKGAAAENNAFFVCCKGQ